MRWLEFGLFAAPFLLYGAWRLSAARARPGLVWAALLLVALWAAGTIWFGLSRGLERGEAYEPAHVERGRVVPGRGVWHEAPEAAP